MSTGEDKESPRAVLTVLRVEIRNKLLVAVRNLSWKSKTENVISSLSNFQGNNIFGKRF